MAQHYPIDSFPQQYMKRIKQGILANFASTRWFHPKSSFRFEYTKELSDFYRDDQNEEVCLAHRTVPKGCPFGFQNPYRELPTISLEIHFNPRTNTVNAIYMVA